MLKKFAVTNYRGFKDRLELDLSHPGSYNFNSNAVRGGIVKDLIIYGPNGSGKSNLGFAMFDIVQHLTQKQKDSEAYYNFSYGADGLPVRFEYSFQFGSDSVDYEYSKDSSGRLLSERLAVGNLLYFDREGGKVELNKDLFSIRESALDDLINQANNVSIVSYIWSTQPLSEGSVLLKFKTFVDGMLWFRCLENRGYIGFEAGRTELEPYIIQNGLQDDFSAFLREVSGQAFTFAKPESGDKQLFCVINGHRLPFQMILSTGTSSLLLLYYWITKLKEASFVFIDEFDAFYHFELSFAVCKRLFAFDCQVALTTHDTSLMTNDMLRPDCYFIIDGKQIKPLPQCTNKELRLGHNLEKIYRGGGFVL